LTNQYIPQTFSLPICKLPAIIAALLHITVTVFGPFHALEALFTLLVII